MSNYILWYSVPALAQKLGYKNDTVRRWIKAGVFGPLDHDHVTMMGGRWRVSTKGYLFGMKNGTPPEGDELVELPVAARTAGELGRKIGHD